jgi:hypothetical protein
MKNELFGWAAAADRAEAAAGASRGTEGQQATGAELGVIVANDRDRRTLAWLRERLEVSQRPKIRCAEKSA